MFTTASLIHWVITAGALLLTAYLVPGFRVKSFGSALIAALVIGLLNILIRPLLIFLTLPINILTLGLFTFVVNGIILKICAYILKDFDIDSWFSAIVGALVMAILSWLLYAFLPF